MFSLLSTWSLQRWSWLLLAFISSALMVIALYFQYGMGLAPCIMCVYQRAALCGVILASLVGAYGRNVAPLRWLALIGWIVAAGWGLKIAHDQVVIEQIVASGGFSTCAIFAEFPRWLLLDKWLPALFNPTGMCGEIAWTFMGYSMAFWMRVIFGMMLLVALLVTASQLHKPRHNPYD